MSTAWGSRWGQSRRNRLAYLTMLRRSSAYNLRATAVRAVAPVPPRQAGQVITDEGDAAVQIADFLVAQRLL